MTTTSKVSNISPAANKTAQLPRDVSLTASYERYLRLPELSELWSSRDFPSWGNESLLKPAIQALEITFRLISIALSDPRPYTNHREWNRRLESLAAMEIEIIAEFCEEEDSSGDAPVVDLKSSSGVLTRDNSSHEVWQIPGCNSSFVIRPSEESLLPRLATWEKSKEIASKIQLQIETRMQGSRFTLGLGEPNLAKKPILEYDLLVRPSDLHSLKNPPFNDLHNHENHKLYTIHQILESWLASASHLARRIAARIDSSNFPAAAGDCWLLERIWKLLAGIIDLHLLMDPDDLLRLKAELALKASNGSKAFCFRSAALLQLTTASGKELKKRVPLVVGANPDPNGGPRLQEATMRLFNSGRRGEEMNAGRIHLLQAFQAVEAGVKRFYFGYRQVVTVAMGSLEATECRPLAGLLAESSDLLSQMFLEPPYFPSLDAAKTFLGELWRNVSGRSDTRCGMR